MNTDAKFFNQILATQVQERIKSRIYFWIARIVQQTEISQCHTPHYKNEGGRVIVSRDAGGGFDGIQVKTPLLSGAQPSAWL